MNSLVKLALATLILVTLPLRALAVETVVLDTSYGRITSYNVCYTKLLRRLSIGRPAVPEGSPSSLLPAAWGRLGIPST